MDYSGADILDLGAGNITVDPAVLLGKLHVLGELMTVIILTIPENCPKDAQSHPPKNMASAFGHKQVVSTLCFAMVHQSPSLSKSCRKNWA